MTNPWDGPRHRSWASDTVITFALLVICITATVITDVFGEPPNYLVALLGTAAGAFFTAIGTDKQKRDAEIQETAKRAEHKAEAAQRQVDATDIRADQAERREGGWSQHLNHPARGGENGEGGGK